MSSGDAKQGPLTIADLLAIWTAAVDKGYSDPLLAAGEGGGLEVYTQLMAQLARASQAVDTTTQALYIRPWSGQTAPPASGEAKATVTLTFARNAFLDRPVRLAAGQVYVDEQTTDWGDPAGVEVLTGRRYVLLEDVVFLPGERGPVDVAAEAEFPGWGYNNPLPGTLQVVDQPAAGFYHDRASVVVAPPPSVVTQPPPQLNVFLRTVNEADTFVPEHVGQYVAFTSGANADSLARVSSFAGPDPVANVGSVVGLEVVTAVESASVTLPLIVGELAQIKSGGTPVGWAQIVASHAGPTMRRIGFVLLSGTVSVGNTMTGLQSTSVVTVSLVTANAPLAQEITPPSAAAGAGANWRVLDWSVDLGVTVTNALQPSGGLLGFLDALGDERGTPRAPGENDTSYRARVAEVGDVVVPNAIRRSLVRVLGSTPFCLREPVGGPLLPGFYYDKGDDNGDAYDYDALVFTGTYTGSPPQDANGSPLYADACALRDSDGNQKVLGWTGRIDGPGGGATLTVIRRQGLGTVASPYAFAAGDTVTSLNGAYVFTIGAYAPDPYATLYRWRCYFDYVQFRAFFVVGVPRVGFGEFGFAWGALPGGANGPNNFYDVAAGPNAYDGFPAGAAAFYGRVQAAVDKARAGGVTFDLYLTDGAACV